MHFLQSILNKFPRASVTFYFALWIASCLVTSLFPTHCYEQVSIRFKTCRPIEALNWSLSLGLAWKKVVLVDFHWENQLNFLLWAWKNNQVNNLEKIKVKFSRVCLEVDVGTKFGTKSSIKSYVCLRFDCFSFYFSFASIYLNLAYSFHKTITLLSLKSMHICF